MIAKIALERIEKVSIYVNTKRRSMSQIKAEIGCDYIINGGLFDMSTFKPMNHLVVDGKILSNSPGKTGASFNGSKIELSYDNQIGYPDHLSGYPLLIANGKIQNFIEPSGLGGARPRSCIGKTKDCFILATFEGCTLKQAAQKMLDLGCIWAINLDGGGSTQADFAGQKDPATRVVHNFICVWLKQEQTTKEVDGMTIIQDFIPKGRKNRPGRSNPRLYITIHDTDNVDKGADALAHASYLKSDAAVKAQVSWHYTVDDKRVVQHIPDNEDAWHAGDGAGDGNRKSIGIEICTNSDGNRLKAADNAVELVAKLCKEHNIPVSKVVQHNHWNGKSCPRLLRAGNPYSWDTFIAKVRNLVEKPAETTPKTDEPSDWARVGWDLMKNLGIMDGTRPRDGVTREELAVVVFRTIQMLKE